MVVRKARDWLRKDWKGLGELLRPFKPPAPGLYSFQDQGASHAGRFHLRVEPGGEAVLFVDVTEAIHLNPSAAWMAKLCLDGIPLARARAGLERCFGPSGSPGILGMVDEVYDFIQRLGRPDGDCPFCGTSWVHTRTPFENPVQAPFKIDLALTYRCSNRCGHCYNPPERRNMAGLSLAQWNRVLEKVRDIGIPHVIFTGGEPTLAPFLPDLIRTAKGLGLVCGMNTNGRRLADPSFSKALARAGLDHVQITLESFRSEIHDAMTGASSFEETCHGLKQALAAGLWTITNTTLTRRNAADAAELVTFLARAGVKTLAMNGMIHAGCGFNQPEALAEEDLGPILARVKARALDLGLGFLWYTPTEYCRFSPMELDIGAKRCNAGEYSCAVEPNGDVLPCQSYYHPCGNLLTDPWDRIWNNALFQRLRNRTRDPVGAGLPEECGTCPDLAICGGGCPLSRLAKTTAVSGRPKVFSFKGVRFEEGPVETGALGDHGPEKTIAREPETVNPHPERG